MPWSSADIADDIARGLRGRAREDDLEQAVYGLDALDELGLHPVIQNALRGAGHGVWPEERYPSDRLHPSKSKGKRCDIVLTPGPEALPLLDIEIKNTLFAQAPVVDPSEAYWLEIKTVAQYETSGPFRRYSAELLSPVAEDVRKLWSDEFIRFGGLLLVLFTESEEVANHDMLAWHRKCLDRGYPVSTGALRGFPITDRIGNRWCALGVFPVRG